MKRSRERRTRFANRWGTDVFGPVYITPEKFENSFISTVRSTVHTNPSRKRSVSKTLFNPEKSENQALFPRLSLPSTQIPIVFHHSNHLRELPLEMISVSKLMFATYNCCFVSLTVLMRYFLFIFISRRCLIARKSSLRLSEKKLKPYVSRFVTVVAK